MEQVVKIGIKEQTAAGWQCLAIQPFVNMTLLEVYKALENREVVCKFDLPNGAGGYLCGTPALADKYKARGFKAYTVIAGVEGIKRGPNAAILNEIPFPGEVGAYEGLTFEEYIWGGPA